MKGVDPKTVQEYLGHSTIQVTEKYSHLLKSHKHQAIDVLNFLNGSETKLKQIGGRITQQVVNQRLENAEGGI